MQKQTLLLVVIAISGVLMGIYYHSTQSPKTMSLSYVERLVKWAKMYQPVQLADIEAIQESVTMKEFFNALKKVPTCRCAKLLAHLYFSIYVERDPKALREFIDLMKDHYPSRYQWDNAFHWKQAEHLLWSTYDQLPDNDESVKKSKPKKSKLKLETDSKPEQTK